MNDDSLIEAERYRLAELLNTSVIHPLNLLLSQASVYEQVFGADAQVGMVISVLASLARQVLQQTLDLQADLQPTLLDVLGIEAALETLVQQKIRANGVQITLKIDAGRQRYPASLELALFRAAQDALDTTIKRARASRVDLSLSDDLDTLLLTCRDNGVASLPRTLLTDTQQRIAALGGEIETETATLRIRLPIAPAVSLTGREHEIIVLIADGLTNKQIAHRLELSARTVNFHLDNIYSKLGVNTRTEAAIYAIRQGWAASKP
jgi:DNA-binding NarL/FixJ family response regulator